jgi:hypothetical protein
MTLPSYFLHALHLSTAQSIVNMSYHTGHLVPDTLYHHTAVDRRQAR